MSERDATEAVADILELCGVPRHQASIAAAVYLDGLILAAATAERERCAGVAERLFTHVDENTPFAVYQLSRLDAGAGIASAIRGGEQP